MGVANDRYERQADHIADKVIAGETQLFQRHIAQKPQLINVQSFQPQNKGLQSKAHDTSRADSQAASSPLAANAVAAEVSEHARKPDDRSLQAQEQEREVQAQQEEPLQAQEQDEEVRPQQDEDAFAITQRKQQEVSTRQERDQLQHAQAEEREVQAQQTDEEEPLQKKTFEGSRQPDPDPHRSLREARQRNGSPLPEAVRDRMERAFSKDFSGVRIHTDDAAVLLNEDLSARALTSGQHIFFNSGEFQPASRQGEHLLAHELTHVVQQREMNGAYAELQRKQESPQSYQTRPELLKAVQAAPASTFAATCSTTSSAAQASGTT